MKPEAFIFDIGNVLLRFDYNRAFRAVQAAGGPAPDRAAIEALGHRYERGGIESGAFLEQLGTITRHALPDADLARAWQDIFEPIPAVWDVVEKLHGRYPLYLLSNTNALQHDHIVERYPILGKFSDGVYSYQAGCMKPEPEIFTRAIAQFGVSPETTVYIDDVTVHIEAGRRAGLHAVQYDLATHGEFLAALQQLGVTGV